MYVSSALAVAQHCKRLEHLPFCGSKQAPDTNTAEPRSLPPPYLTGQISLSSFTPARRPAIENNLNSLTVVIRFTLRDDGTLNTS